jgi:hypothetical protein
MKHPITLLVAIMLIAVMVVSSGCGRTIYRAKVYKSNKYIKNKTRYHFWHAHGARPRGHSRGGYY